MKSELITRKGLKETDFVTANYARAYYNNKDVVVVTLRVPAKNVVEPQPAKEGVKREAPAPQEVTVKKKEEPVAEKQPEANVERQPVPSRSDCRQNRSNYTVLPCARTCCMMPCCFPRSAWNGG